MDFARQSTLVLLQPDCRRAGRSHLIKASILATLPARSVAYNCQGALLEHPVLETLLPLLLCNTSSARSRVQDVLRSKGEAAGACCAMEGEAACLPAISGRCCPMCVRAASDPFHLAAAMFVRAVRAQTRGLTASRVTRSCQFLAITSPFSVLSGFQESIVGNCMDRSSPGQAMQVPDHNGLGYPVRPAAGEHPRPRTLQRHHTIQNSDDAYVSPKRPAPSRARGSAERPQSAHPCATTENVLAETSMGSTAVLV